MSKLLVRSFSVSLDGYGAGPDQDLKNPLGVGGALARLALAKVREAALAMKDQGSFRWVRDILPRHDVRTLFPR